MKVKLSGSLMRPTIRKELIFGVTSVHAVLMLIFIVAVATLASIGPVLGASRVKIAQTLRYE